MNNSLLLVEGRRVINGAWDLIHRESDGALVAPWSHRVAEYLMEAPKGKDIEDIYAKALTILLEQGHDVC